MKIIQYIVFYVIFFTIFGLANYYIYLRGSQALESQPAARRVYPFVFIIFGLSFIIGRFLEKATICAASDFFIWTGSFWFAYMLYFILAIIFFDFLRLANHFIGFYPSFVKDNYQQFKFYLALSVSILTTIVIIAGYINAKNPRVKKIQISVPKKAGSTKQLKIALATDIHLGTIITNSRLQKLVDMLNAFKPDIVLLAGDIVDEDLKPVIENNLGEQLKTISSTYGTFAVTGNHEYIGGVEEACKYLEDHNVTVIRDSFKLIANSFYIIGREDRSISRFTGQERKPLHKIIEPANTKLPLILMDHQPFGLDEAVKNKIDLQFSGHTHKGQLWPVTYIVNAIYELSYGYKKTGNTHFYVSSGFGTWGPPVRTGNTPEVVYITIDFK